MATDENPAAASASVPTALNALAECARLRQLGAHLATILTTALDALAVAEKLIDQIEVHIRAHAKAENQPPYGPGA